MSMAALWLQGAVVLAGVGLSCFYLAERPIRGWFRLLSWAHGAAGAIAVGLVLAALSGQTPAAVAPDAKRFANLAAWFLGAALAGGLLVLVSQCRRRRPPGLVVALHATLGVAGAVIWAAYISVSR